MSKDAFFSSLLREASTKRKKENIIAVVPEGGFRGNTKAAFLILSELIKRKRLDWKACWISSDGEMDLLVRNNFFSLSRDKERNAAADLFMRAKYVLYGTHALQDIDSWFWQSCRSSAKTIQLWHGIPAKQIAFELQKNMKNSYRFAGMASDCLSYDYCIPESPAVCSSYAKAFPSSILLPFGASRNDFLVRDDYDDLLYLGFDKNLLNKLKNIRNGSRIVLLSPTYREAGYSEEWFCVFIGLIERLAERSDCFVIVKLHPVHLVNHKEDSIKLKKLESKCERVFVASPNSDIYPYLKLADVLITDYSSVITDFLITGRPIVYFRPDEESYWKTRDKPMLSLYDENKVAPVFTEVGECVDFINSGDFDDYLDYGRLIARRLHANYGTGMAAESLLEFIVSSG